MHTISAYIEKTGKWFLRKVYGFDRWHISSLDQRKYAIDIIIFSNHLPVRNSCAEIGCGLGDIIRNLDYVERYGYDNDKKVLNAAKLLDRFSGGKPVQYNTFSFPADELNRKFNLIIMVNWIHHIEPAILKNKIDSMLKHNIEPDGHIIIDAVQDPEYRYNHNIQFLSEGLNCTFSSIGKYPRNREIWSIKKVGE